MVSILISRSKLGHLQKHVCSYIVAAISKKASCLMMTGRCPCVLRMARWTLEPIYGIRDKHQYSQFKSLDIYLKSFQNLLTRRKTDTKIEQESRANRCRGSADYSKNGKSSIRPGLENQAGVQAHMCRGFIDYSKNRQKHIHRAPMESIPR